MQFITLTSSPQLVLRCVRGAFSVLQCATALGSLMSSRKKARCRIMCVGRCCGKWRFGYKLSTPVFCCLPSVKCHLRLFKTRRLWFKPSPSNKGSKSRFVVEHYRSIKIIFNEYFMVAVGGAGEWEEKLSKQRWASLEPWHLTFYCDSKQQISRRSERRRVLNVMLFPYFVVAFVRSSCTNGYCKLYNNIWCL